MFSLEGQLGYKWLGIGRRSITQTSVGSNMQNLSRGENPVVMTNAPMNDRSMASTNSSVAMNY